MYRKKPIEINDRTEMQSTPDKVKVHEVIKITLVRGEGTEESPIRHVYQFWEKDGSFITEIDSIDKY